MSLTPSRVRGWRAIGADPWVDKMRSSLRRARSGRHVDAGGQRAGVPPGPGLHGPRRRGGQPLPPPPPLIDAQCGGMRGDAGTGCCLCRLIPCPVCRCRGGCSSKARPCPTLACSHRGRRRDDVLARRHQTCHFHSVQLPCLQKDLHKGSISGDIVNSPSEHCSRSSGMFTEVARSVPPYLLMAKRALDGADGLVGRVSTLRPGGLRFDTL